MLRVKRRRTTALTGSRLYPGLWALLAGLLLSASASAANHVRSDCTGADFLRSTADPNSLTVDVVDLGDELGEGLLDPESETAAELLSIDPDDSLAPLLYLAPRVATILENVFDDDSEAGLLDADKSSGFSESALDERALDAGNSRSMERSPVAPVAERRIPAAVPGSDHPALNIEPAYLKIHRQMYRTDI